MIGSINKPLDAGVVDVGGGSSLLAVHLARAGYHPITVVDISAAALEQAKERAGEGGAAIDWTVADIADFNPTRTYGIWHDRAVFHFLTDAADRQKYLAAIRRALSSGGHAIIAAFAPDGPEQCSGLPVCRYDTPAIKAEFGEDFLLMETVPETHLTPWGSEQKFNYFHFQQRRNPS